MYNNLKNHLSTKLNQHNTHTIVEASGGTSSKSGFWGTFGSFWSRFINNDNSEKDKPDAITAELARQEQDAETTAKKREKDLLNAKENAIAQKLAAKYEAKKNKATLANQRKIDAWNAKRAKAKAAADYWKNNKLERTQAEMDAWEAELEKSFSALGENGYDSDMERFNTSTYLVAWHEDGTMRTKEEIDACVKAAEKAATTADYDPSTDPDVKDLISWEKNSNWREVAEHASKLKKLASDHQEDITDAISGGELDMQKLLQSVQENAVKAEQTKSTAEQAESVEKVFKRNKAAIIAVNQMTEKLKAEQDKLDEAGAEVEKYTKPGTDNYFKYDSGTDLPTFDGTPDNLKKLIKSVTSSDDIKDLTGDDKLKAIKEKLKKLGIPATDVETIFNGISDISANNVQNVLDENVDGLDTTALGSIKDGVNKSLKTAYNKAKNNYDAIDQRIQSMPDPSKGLDEKPNIGWLEQQGDSKLAIQLRMFKNPNYNGPGPDGETAGDFGINADDIASELYTDPDQEKIVSDAAKNARKEADKAAAEQEARRQTIKEKRAQAAAAEAHESMPSEIKDAIEVEKDKLGEGECFNDKGEVGFIDEKGKFHKKPSKDADTDVINAYVAARKKAIMLNPQQRTAKQITNVGEKETAEGVNKGKYKVTYVDDNGEEKTTYMTAQEIAIEKANSYRNSENKALSETYLRNAADVITKKCLGSDGKIDPAKVKELKDDEKELFNVLAQLQKDEKLEGAFKGLDLGNTTWHALKDAIGDSKLSELSGGATPAAAGDENTDVSADDFNNGDELVGTKEGDKEVKYIKKSDGKFYKVVGDVETEMDFDKWIEAVENDKEASKDMAAILDDDMEDDDFKDTDHDENNDDAEPDRKRTNPRKIWRPYKYKRGDKTVTSKSTYVNKRGDRISRDEFDKRCASYDRFKAKHPDRVNDSLIYINLGNHLFESIGNTTNKYSKLRDCILNKLNS